MKMMINAAGVRKLIEYDPENTVELAKSAAAQVAHDIVRRTVRPMLEKAMIDSVSGYIDDNRGYSGTITNHAQQIFNKMIEINVEKISNQIKNGMLLEQVNAMVDNVFQMREKQMSEKLDKLLDEKIKQKMVEFFGGKQ